MKKSFIALCVLLGTILLITAGCTTDSNQTQTPGSTETPNFNREEESPQPPQDAWPPPADSRSFAERTSNTVQATITMEDGGIIVLELFPDLAPQSVRNFVYLARQGYYDGLKFHRIMSGFMVQGGCPNGNGGGDPGYMIRGEFNINGFVNELSHTRGVVSMARRQDPFYDSAGSQFFIVHANSSFLDGSYAGFGFVVEGMDVVDAIAETPAIDNNGTVLESDMPVIASVTIDSDIVLPPPDKLQ